MHKKSGNKVYFWIFVSLAILSAFLFWAARNKGGNNDQANGINISLISAIIALVLSIMFGLFTFVRFIRSRSIVGGLFLTTAISTMIFLGSSQIVASVIPAHASIFTNDPSATDNNIAVVVGLAQIGLFALWFLFLLMTIYIQVSPVKRIDRQLQKILDGEELARIRVGKSKQYKSIEEKLHLISRDISTRREAEAARREKAKQRREAQKAEYMKAMAALSEKNI